MYFISMLSDIDNKCPINFNTCLNPSMKYDKTKSLSRVDASYDGSISTKITLSISPYKIFLNDSSGHGCYFFQCIIIIFE
jgi:hypothetical protein